MEKIQFKILGKDWTVLLLKKKKYKNKYGNDSVAICHTTKRRIDLGPNGRDLETIVHEMVHAYLAECCTHSADLDDDALEEIFAELMAKRGKELLALCDELHQRIALAQLDVSDV